MGIFIAAAIISNAVNPGLPEETHRVLVTLAVSADGSPTPVWHEAVIRLRGVPVEMRAKPLSEQEKRWLRLIRDRSIRWPAESAAVATNFPGIHGPAQVRVIVGNQAAEDAFVHDADTIAFDVARLTSIYGDASSPANTERIDRFFRHEYAHLLQKRWLAKHPFVAKRPLNRALLGMWSEGIGNYYSLSEKWRLPSGQLSPAARDTLERLAPIVAARLAALSCATDAGEASLTADLSMGPFDRKWGALPVALWLAEESAGSPTALRDFVAAGPAGVWAVLERHLRPPLTQVIAAAEMQNERCSEEA
jgi:hypothetical protein